MAGATKGMWIQRRLLGGISTRRLRNRPVQNELSRSVGGSESGIELSMAGLRVDSGNAEEAEGGEQDHKMLQTRPVSSGL